MTSKLERKWWFQIPVIALALILTAYLIYAAGFPNTYSFARWMLYSLSFIGLKRAISFIGWLLVLCLSPADVVAERTK